MAKVKIAVKGILGFVIMVIGAVLGALGGAEKSNKSFRRVLIPLILTGFAYLNTESILVLTIMSMCGALSIGYGIPSYEVVGGIEPPVRTDEGSIIGSFFYKLFKGNLILSDIFTRGTIGILIGLSLISIPLIIHNYLIYVMGCIGIILTNSLVSWQNWGQYTLFNRKLNWSDTINWGLITLFAVLIIILK
jgi:hypothetical protein